MLLWDAGMDAGMGVDMGIDVDADLDIDMAGDVDPMFSDDSLDLSDGDEALMAQIFAEQGENHGFGRQASEDKKAAPQRPQPRKPSTGVTRLASVQRVASANDADIAELEKLWPTAPDLSDVFK